MTVLVAEKIAPAPSNAINPARTTDTFTFNFPFMFLSLCYESTSSTQLNLAHQLPMPRQRFEGEQARGYQQRGTGQAVEPAQGGEAYGGVVFNPIDPAPPRPSEAIDAPD